MAIKLISASAKLPLFLTWVFLPPFLIGVPITDPAYFSQMSEADLARVLRSDNDTPMPMLKERHQALTEAGQVLMQHGGSFRNFISHGQNDAEKMVRYIVDNIPSYRDEVTYEVYRNSMTVFASCGFSAT